MSTIDSVPLAEDAACQQKTERPVSVSQTAINIGDDTVSREGAEVEAECVPFCCPVGGRSLDAGRGCGSKQRVFGKM